MVGNALHHGPLARARSAGILLCSGLLAACSQATDSPHPAQLRPNLLLTVFDTTRADHLSCYGYPQATTPTIDALAAGGLLCEAAFAQSSLTPISASTFLTGVLPPRHGVRSLFSVGRERIESDIPTLAERLVGEGYATAGFVSAPPMGARYGLGRGFAVFDDKPDPRSVERGGGNAFQRRADATCDLALEWLRTALGKSEPFFLWVHFFDAHDAALVPPRAFLEQHTSFELPADLDAKGHLRGIKSDRDRIELYDAEIRYQDEQFARLMDVLDASGKRASTLVSMLADHGEGLGQHDFWTHGLLYEEQLHVPWVLAGPGLPRGVRLAQRVRLVDLVPTLAQLLDLELSGPPLDGASILPLLSGPESAARDVYAEVHHAADDSLGRDAAMYSLTAGPLKLIHRPISSDHELYQLDIDARELENRFDPTDQAALLLQARIEARLGGIEPGANADQLDEATRAMLRELGYM